MSVEEEEDKTSQSYNVDVNQHEVVANQHFGFGAEVFPITHHHGEYDQKDDPLPLEE